MLQKTTQTQMDYHRANNAKDDDACSIMTLEESMSNLKTAANENTRVMNDNISQLATTTNELRQSLLATQQQLALLTRQNMQPQQQLWIQPPPLTAPTPYAPAPYAVGQPY